MFCEFRVLWGAIKMNTNIFQFLLKSKQHKNLWIVILFAFSSVQANDNQSLHVFKDMVGEHPVIMNPTEKNLNSDLQTWIENRCHSLNQAQGEYDLLIHQTSIAVGASAAVGFATLFFIPGSMLKEIHRSRALVRKDYQLMQKEYQSLDNVVGGKTIDEIQDPNLRQRVLSFYQQREAAHSSMVHQSNLEQRTYRTWAKKSVITGGVVLVPSLAGIKWIHEKALAKKAQIEELQDALQKELGENSKAKCREL
jgi:hypothetical protein